MSFWNNSSEKLIIELNSTLEGLSTQSATDQLKTYGANSLIIQRRHPVWQFLMKFSNPLVLILLFASGVSALTGEAISFVLIILIVLLSVILDFVQNYRAEQAAESLKKSVLVNASVYRDKKLKEIPFSEIVPGDVVQLSAGDLVPADGIILTAKDLFLNQAMLTGESYPVEKTFTAGGTSGEDLSLATNAVFMGTSVVSGQGRALIVQTGAKTSFGKIAESLSEQAPPTSFDIGIRRFGYLIMRLTVALVLFVIFINFFFHRPMLESFLFAIALAVGLTPELLPMIITVTLSRGALRMAKKQVIVKKLTAIQNFGDMDILCSDKTGTLTEGQIFLERHVDIEGRESSQVLKLAYLNSFFETGLKSPIDRAILEHKEVDISEWKKVDEVPFDFERRRVSVLVDQGEKRFLIVKGATDEILSLSQSYELGDLGKPILFNELIHQKVIDLRNQLEADGFRAIGVAWKEVPMDHLHAVISDEAELVFAGIAAFHDPPKAGIQEVIRELEKNHVQLKVVTGDSELVTRHLFSQMNITVTATLSGTELQKMDDPTLLAIVETVNLFCRVSPPQKNRIILALKSRGHTVGYIGDGVNDAPSLHSADVGFSVEGAVDVAKDAADIILLKKDLSVLNAGIIEGRRTHTNIMKYIMMGASSNLGNMFSMAGATLFLPFLPMLPFQILLNNFLYDISEVTIPMDSVDPSQITHPTSWDIGFVHRFMWAIGLVSSLFDFFTFYILRTVFQANESLFHTGWFVESIATQVLVIFVIRTRLRPWQSRPSRALVVTSFSVVGFAALLPFTPLAQALGFVPLNFSFFAILAGTVVTYLFCVEGIKRWFYQRYAKS